MNLPKKLEKFRDMKAKEKYPDHLQSALTSGLQFKPFCKGFNAACEILLPEIEKMLGALDSGVSDFYNSNVYGIDVTVLEQALKQWQEFVEGE